jgi:hypothetical protein
MSKDETKPAFDATQPPEGAWFEQTADGVRVGVTYKSRGNAVIMACFTAVWGGITMGATYGNQIIDGEFDLFASIIGLPFLAATVFLIGVVCMAAAGKTEITITPEQCEIFTGAFGIGLRKRFDPIEVVGVTEEKVAKEREDYAKPTDPAPEPTRKIWITTNSEKFSILPASKERSVYLLLVLREYLVPGGRRRA